MQFNWRLIINIIIAILIMIRDGDDDGIKKLEADVTSRIRR